MAKDNSPDRMEVDTSELAEQLRSGKIERRTFLQRAAALGVSFAAASALATDALAQERRTRRLRSEGGPTPTVVIRIPESLELSESEIEQLERDFQNQLIEAIERSSPSGADAPTVDVEMVALQ